MITLNNSSGKAGEEYAARLLEQKGYRILERNYHSRFGEIDIIAAAGQYLVFVEVKTRAENALISPLEAVTAAKRRKLIKTAQYYLYRNRTELQPRFDVIALITDRSGQVLTEDHLENAFDGVSF